MNPSSVAAAMSTLDAQFALRFSRHPARFMQAIRAIVKRASYPKGQTAPECIDLPFGPAYSSSAMASGEGRRNLGARPLLIKWRKGRFMWFKDLQHFAENISLLPTAIRELHEVVPAGEPCRFVLDWDLKAVAGDAEARIAYRRDLEILLQASLRALGVSTEAYFRANDWKSVLWADASRKKGTGFKYSFRVVARNLLFDSAGTMAMLKPVMRHVARTEPAMSERLAYWNMLIGGVDTDPWRFSETQLRMVGSRNGDQEMSYFLPFYPDVDPKDAEEWQMGFLQQDVDPEWLRASLATEGVPDVLVDGDPALGDVFCFTGAKLKAAAISAGCSDVALSRAWMSASGRSAPGGGMMPPAGPTVTHAAAPGSARLDYDPNAPPPEEGDAEAQRHAWQWRTLDLSHPAEAQRISTLAAMLESCLRVRGDLTSVVSTISVKCSVDGSLWFVCHAKNVPRTCPSGSTHSGHNSFRLIVQPTTLKVLYKCMKNPKHPLCSKPGLGVEIACLSESEREPNAEDGDDDNGDADDAETPDRKALLELVAPATGFSLSEESKKWVWPSTVVHDAQDGIPRDGGRFDFDSRWITADPKFTAIVAPMGAGKTAAIHEYLKGLFAGGRCTSGIFLTCRLVLGSSFAGRFKDLGFVNVHGERGEVVRQFARVIQQYQSIRHLARYTRLRSGEPDPRSFTMRVYDVVILDEVRSLIESMLSVKTNGENGQHIGLNFELLRQIVHNAKRVILLDADMLDDGATRELLEILLGPLPSSLSKMHVLTGRGAGMCQRFEIEPDKKCVELAMCDAVRDAPDGRPVLMCAGSRMDAIRLFAALKQDQPLRRGVLYHGGGTEVHDGRPSDDAVAPSGEPPTESTDPASHFQRVNQVWPGFHYIIYTTRVMVGVNYTGPCSRIFLMTADRKGPTPREQLQQVSRARSSDHGSITCWLRPDSKNANQKSFTYDGFLEQVMTEDKSLRLACVRAVDVVAAGSRAQPTRAIREFCVRANPLHRLLAWSRMASAEANVRWKSVFLSLCAAKGFVAGARTRSQPVPYDADALKAHEQRTKLLNRDLARNDEALYDSLTLSEVQDSARASVVSLCLATRQPVTARDHVLLRAHELYKLFPDGDTTVGRTSGDPVADTDPDALPLSYKQFKCAHDHLTQLKNAVAYVSGGTEGLLRNDFDLISLATERLFTPDTLSRRILGDVCEKLDSIARTLGFRCAIDTETRVSIGSFNEAWPRVKTMVKQECVARHLTARGEGGIQHLNPLWQHVFGMMFHQLTSKNRKRKNPGDPATIGAYTMRWVPLSGKKEDGRTKAKSATLGTLLEPCARKLKEDEAARESMRQLIGDFGVRGRPVNFIAGK